MPVCVHSELFLPLGVLATMPGAAAVAAAAAGVLQMKTDTFDDILNPKAAHIFYVNVKRTRR